MGDAICSIEGCTKKVRTASSGVCNMHYTRMWRHGSYDTVKPRGTLRGDLHPQWKADEVGYRGLHQRIHRERGAASQYTCVDCGRQAQEWSYDYQDSNEVREKGGYQLLYSPNVDHYDPRCTICHKAFDLRMEESPERLAERPVASASGIRGIGRNKNRWVVKFTHQGQMVHVGRFKELDDAKAALADRQRELGIAS